MALGRYSSAGYAVLMSDMGWMMGPWEVFGTLLLGASMLYDGAPLPGYDRIWRWSNGIMHLPGIAPTFIVADGTWG
jgi:acetyl-CoA synthetase